MDLDGINEYDLEQFVESRIAQGTSPDVIVDFAKRRFARNTDDNPVIEKLVVEHYARVVAQRVKAQGGSKQHAKDFIERQRQASEESGRSVLRINYNRVIQIVDQVFGPEDRLQQAVDRRDQEAREREITRERIERETNRRVAQARASVEAYQRTPNVSAKETSSYTELSLQQKRQIIELARKWYRIYADGNSDQRIDQRKHSVTMYVMDNIKKEYAVDEYFIKVVVDEICRIYDSARGILSEGTDIDTANGFLVSIYVRDRGEEKEKGTSIINITSVDKSIVEDIVKEVYSKSYISPNLFAEERQLGRNALIEKEKKEQRLKQEKEHEKRVADLKTEREKLEREEAELRLKTNKEQQKMIEEQLEDAKNAGSYEERRRKLDQLQEFQQRAGVRQNLRSAFPALAGYNLPDEFFMALMMHRSENDLRKMVIGYQKEGRISQEDAVRILEHIKQAFGSGSGFSTSDRENFSRFDINSNSGVVPGDLRSIDDVNRVDVDSERRREEILQGNFRNVAPKNYSNPRATEQDLIEIAGQQFSNDATREQIYLHGPQGAGKPVLDRWMSEEENEKIVEEAVDAAENADSIPIITDPDTAEAVQEFSDELIPPQDQIESGEATSVDPKIFPTIILGSVKTNKLSVLKRDIRALHIAIDAALSQSGHADGSGLTIWKNLQRRARGSDKKDAKIAADAMKEVLDQIYEAMKNLGS